MSYDDAAMPAMPEYYLCMPDGRCAYPIPESVRAPKWTADGAPAESRVIWDRNHNQTWVITAGPACMLVGPIPRSVVSEYRLKDEAAASAKFPLVVTREEFASLDSEISYGLYKAAYVDSPVDSVTLDVSQMQPMPGVVDDHPGVDWEPDKASLLIYGPLYGNIMPGAVMNLRNLVGTALRGHYGTTAQVYDHDPREISVTLHLVYDVPVFSSRQKTSRSTGKPLRGTEKVQEQLTTRVELIPPRMLPAASKAEGVAAVGALVAEYVELIDSYSPVACSHCKGRGYIATKDAQPATQSNPGETR